MKFIRILLKKLLVTFIFFFKKKNKFLLNWDSCRPHLGTGWPSHDLLPLPAIWAAHKTLFFKEKKIPIGGKIAFKKKKSNNLI